MHVLLSFEEMEAQIAEERPQRVDGYLTTPQVAKRFGVESRWLYRRIKRGAIDIKLDPDKKMYLFPNSVQVIEDLCSLRDGTVAAVGRCLAQ